MSPSVSSPNPAQVSATAHFKLATQVNHLLALPKGYSAQRGRRWPLLVFLHGSGERGESTDILRKFGPAKRIEEGAEFPFILLTPLCPAYEWWHLDAIEALIADICRRHRVDRDRIYLTGLSMGGYGVWGLAAKHPERYAAIVPICGAGDGDWAPRLAALPTWVFHGELDPVVPVEHSRAMVRALRAAGGKPKLTIYKNVHHDSWTKAYNTPALYAWLLRQRRKQR